MSRKLLGTSFGFTLAEMMVVILVMTIILAAMAPVLTKKSRSSGSSGVANSIFHWTADDSAAFFGVSPSEALLIGRNSITDDDDAKLIIQTSGTKPNHILFKDSVGNTTGHLKMNSDGGVELGKEASSNTTSVAIGANAKAQSNGSVALGVGAVANQNNTIVLGRAGSNAQTVIIPSGKICDRNSHCVKIEDLAELISAP